MWHSTKIVTLLHPLSKWLLSNPFALKPQFCRGLRQPSGNQPELLVYIVHTRKTDCIYSSETSKLNLMKILIERLPTGRRNPWSFRALVISTLISRCGGSVISELNYLITCSWHLCIRLRTCLSRDELLFIFPNAKTDPITSELSKITGKIMLAILYSLCLVYRGVVLLWQPVLDKKRLFIFNTILLLIKLCPMFSQLTRRLHCFKNRESHINWEIYMRSPVWKSYIINLIK